MDKKDWLMQFQKSNKYTFNEISQITDQDIKTVRTCRDLGVFSKDKSKVYRLKTTEGESEALAYGKDIVDFLSKKDS